MQIFIFYFNFSNFREKLYQHECLLIMKNQFLFYFVTEKKKYYKWDAL